MTNTSPVSQLGRARIGRRGFLFGAALLGVGGPLALAACGGGANAAKSAAGGTPQQGGTLVVGQYQEPTVFDPNRQYSWETYRLDKHIYESLVKEDLSTPASDGVPPIVPALAESWTVSEDKRQYTFALRKGVKFHDGTDFDAEAVRFNIRRFTDPSFEFYDVKAAGGMKAVYGKLRSFDVLDSHTVRYTFADPFLDFLRLLPQGNYVSGIFSPLALQTYGQDGLAEHPSGTGPFTFVERVRGDHTKLVRNEEYWGAKPYLDGIVFRPITDANTRVSALQAGEIDILTRTSPDAVDVLEKAGYTVHESAGAGELFLGWNFKNRFVANKSIRQAIITAIDREGLATTLFRGYAKPNYNIFNVGNEAYDPEQRDFAYDPDAARALIAASPFAGQDITFTLITDEANQPTIEWIQRDLGKVGITVNIVSQEWLTYTSNLSNLAEDVAAFSMEWGFITPYWLQLVYNGYIVARGGGEGLIDPAVAPLLTSAATEVDQDKAIGLWRQANALLQKEAGFVPLLTFDRYFASAPNVGGFNVPNQNFYDLSTVWLAQ